MRKWYDCNVSVNPRVTNPGEIKNCTIKTILSEIQDGRWRGDIEAIRAIFRQELLTNSMADAADRIKPAKAERLQVFCVSGMFTYRRNADLVEHSGKMILDLDNLGEALANTKTLLAEDQHTLALFVSPSGVGLKMIVPVNANNTETHKSCFRTAQQYYRANYGLELCESGSDLYRACFVSYDPDLVMKETAIPFDPITIPESVASTQQRRDIPQQEEVQAALKCIPPDSPYSDWVSIGMAIHSAGMPLTIWDEWSAKGNKYKPGECSGKWHSFGRGAITIATLFFIAKKYGFHPQMRGGDPADRINDDKVSCACIGDNIILPSGSITITDCANTVFKRIAKKRDLYYRGGIVQETVEGDDGKLTLAIVRAESFRSRIEAYGKLQKYVAGKNGQPVLAPAICAKEMAEALLAAPAANDYLPAY